MTYKTLKHKTLPDTYGHPAQDPVELAHSSTPWLLQPTCTYDDIKEVYGDQPFFMEQLPDYDLITINIIPGLTAIDVAAGLFSIHHHDLEGDIIYKESELLPLLKSWGLPEPDWEGNAKRDELELLSPPGDTIKETMEALGIDFPLFLIKMQMNYGDCAGLLDGHIAITPDIAAKLQQVLNIDAQFWLNREANYRAKLSKL